MKKTLPTPDDYKNHERDGQDKLCSEISDHCERIRSEFETSGKKINCAEFHRQIKLIYPHAVMWYSADHIMTEINGFVCDKRGIQFYRIHTGFAVQHLDRSFRWPVHSGPLDGTDDD